MAANVAKKSRFGESTIQITGDDLGYGEKEEEYVEEEIAWGEDMPDSTRALLGQLKKSLKKRGADGIAGLARKFRIVDDDGSGELDPEEFNKAMKEHKMGFTEEENLEIFKFFDQDDSGTITFDEFLGAVRGELNQRRAQLVLMAFDILDADKSGFVEIDDIQDKYDAKSNPDVKAGKKTEAEVLREFLDTFDTGDKDGKVTPDEFCKYYSNVSASIDLDDYFELMIRNAWHIPGGEGWCSNTANKRVLVTHADGSQTVECINDDLGLDLSDPAAIQAKLAEQGVESTGVTTVGKAGDDKEQKKNFATTPAPAKPAGPKSMQSTSLW